MSGVRKNNAQAKPASKLCRSFEQRSKLVAFDAHLGVGVAVSDENPLWRNLMGRTTKAEAVRRRIWVPTFAGTTAEVYSNERPEPLARASQQCGGRSIRRRACSISTRWY
jgi:hypothetical protein